MDAPPAGAYNQSITFAGQDMPETIAVEPEIMGQFHQLAEQTHRPESEIIAEALASYLAADRHYVEVLRQRLASADRGEFASEADAAAFFGAHGA